MAKLRRKGAFSIPFPGQREIRKGAFSIAFLSFPGQRERKNRPERLVSH
jgi:hypothetical protein